MNGQDEPHALAEALVAAQRWDSALDAVSEGLARDPEDPRLLALLVRTLRALGRRAESVEAARRLLTTSPQDPYAFRLATLVLLDVGWVDEAIGLAERAAALGPGNAANHLAVSRAWAASTRPGAVSRQLAAAREALMLDPSSPDAQVQIGAALSASGDPEAARAAYEEALRLDPRNAAALNNLAVLDMRAGTPDSAARHLAASLAADPQGHAALHNLDAVAVRVLRRVGWWMMLSPIPALAAAAAGAVVPARILAGIALLGLPLGVVRWLRALSPGQRTHLRGLHRRVRRWTVAWIVGAAAMGVWGLWRAWVPGADAADLLVYATVAVYAGLLRGAAVLAGRAAPAEVAGLRSRVTRAARGGGRRWRGRRSSGPGESS